MSISYEVVEYVTGILDASKYEISNSEEHYQSWRKLQNDFVSTFSQFSSKNDEDYELTENHYGMKCLCVNLYNEKFYNIKFIDIVLKILKKNGDCFAQFECYSNDLKFIGTFQVYNEIVRFDTISEKNSLIQKLFG